MSEVKVNKISPRTNCGTVQLGDSGDTITIPAGATITNNGTAAGFGATGAASWDTTVKTASFTGVAGVGYFVNTTSGAITVTLPASPDAGAVIAISDYANTADTNNITLARNGSNIEGDASDFVINQEGVAITFVYVDATKGWITTDTGQSKDAFVSPFIIATGGTITECGDCKIHTFTGPGTFTVSNVAGICGPARNQVSYMVVAGGGGGGTSPSPSPGGGHGGGGGGGGFREDKSPLTPYTASPLEGAGPITVTATAFPITVGGGGAGGNFGPGANGSNSVFSTIISTGGGFGGQLAANGAPGGSGGGGGQTGPAGGSGNTPPTSPSQGNNGGAPGGPNTSSGGGGGGATGTGGNGTGSGNCGVGGNGGAGVTSSIDGTPTARAGGGGGAATLTGGTGGTGGGGNGNVESAPVPRGPSGGTAGSTNTGGGGGAAGNTTAGFQGGSGIVVIRYKFQ